ncbi:MAG: hypothetical protein Q7T50_07845, partial [Candidatus Magasanikbacteria bacterium]|nr:hypothetical protein [Candidatus Magasanikbacteria bacterium]
DSQFADEWKIWKNRSADDFLHGRYGEPIVVPEPYKADGKLEWEKDIVHHRPDALEMRNREELRERLQNAHDMIGDPKKGETVADYMAKYKLESGKADNEIFNNLYNSGMIRGGDEVKRRVFEAIQHLNSEMKKELSLHFYQNRGVALGYVRLFAGDRSSLHDGIKGLFDYKGDVNPEDIHIKSDGSIIYENALGKRGFDLLISHEKIAVDGPGWNNLPKSKLNINNLEAAKRFILSGKTAENNIDDYIKMEKGDKIVQHEDLKGGDKDIEKSLDKGVADDTSVKKVEELEKRIEELDKNSSTIKSEDKVFYH